MSFTVFFVGQKAIESQQTHLPELESTLSSKSLNVSFEPDSLSNNIKGDGFVITQDGKVLLSANNISTKHNWIEVMNQFVDNYNNTSEIDGYWGWGQRVPATGDYLCKDCGIVEEFQEGDVFPVCDVCQAGEPDGPSTPAEGYWEAL